jgi:predicted HAD superfamily hydrolase
MSIVGTRHDRRAGHSVEVLTAQSFAMLSLDVFDTSLTRVIGDPSSLFLLLGRKLAITGVHALSPECFARARFTAERRCRENVNGEDVTLDEIYMEFARDLRLSEEQRSRIMREELDLERQLLRPILETLNLVQHARSRGLSVSYVSDTYFPFDFVRDCLRDHGLYQEGDALYTSSSARRTKRTGLLFRDLSSATALPANKVLHRDNDHYADVKMAGRIGCASSHFVEGNLNRYEAIWESFRWETEGFSSLLAGTSRLTRLSVPTRSAKERVLRDVAASVAAATLVGYVIWLLQQAQQRKLRRLYFVSREGEILLAIARSIADRVKFSGDLLYLYGSRQAWHLPSVTSINESINDWLFIGLDHLSVAQVLRRISLKPDDVSPALQRLGFGAGQWERNLSEKERKQLCAIVDDSLFQSVLLDAAATKRIAAIKYFQQVGLADSVSWAIVDVGWAGLIQRSLARILRMAGRTDPPVGLYYGLTDGGNTSEAGTYEAYMLDHRSGSGYGPWNGIVAWPLIDIFCEGTEGQVLEYAIGPDGRTVPVLKEKSNGPAIEWGLPIVRTTILRFAELLCLDSMLTNLTVDIRSATAAVLKDFWSSPTVEEALIWGAFPYEVEQGGGRIRTLGEAYSWRGLGRITRTLS